MTRNEQLNLIDSSFDRLTRACESTHDWDRYLGVVRDEEAKHRKWTPDGCRNGLTRAQSVKLFAVKEVFDCFIPNETGKVFTPEAKDFLHIRTSVFAAHAIAYAKQSQIKAEFTESQMREFLSSVDYVILNRDPNQQAA